MNWTLIYPCSWFDNGVQLIHKLYNYKIKAYKTLNEKLSAYVDNLINKPLIILVDELDRVRPDYNVKFLEAIKHIFSIHGICFVLAVDRKQLENSVRQLYGNIDFENYYRRFVTREVQLTTGKKIDLNSFILQMGNEYFDAKSNAGLKFCLTQESKTQLIQSITNISVTFKFVPRQIQSLFRVLSHFLAIEKTDKQPIFSWLNASVLLIAISIHNKNLYHKIGSGFIKAKELAIYLEELHFSENREKGHVVLQALAFNLSSEDKENTQQSIEIAAPYYNIQLDDDEKERTKKSKIILDYLTETYSSWHDIPTQSSFNHIYSTIEEWRPFIE